MLNILWSALNLTLLLGTAYILFRAAKLVYQHMGSGAMLLFVFALLVLSRHRAAEPSSLNKNLLTKSAQHGPVSNASAQQTISLGGTNQLYLLAEYDANGNTFRPRGLYTSVSGVMLGHQWEPNLGMLQQEGQRLHYWTVLTHHWLLLGTPVFTSSGVEYEGFIKPVRPVVQR
jgi:hypothetical protein